MSKYNITTNKNFSVLIWICAIASMVSVIAYGIKLLMSQMNLILAWEFLKTTWPYWLAYAIVSILGYCICLLNLKEKKQN